MDERKSLVRLMKRFFQFILFLILTTGAALGAFYLSLPTPSEIKGCLVTHMYNVNLCPGSSDYVYLKNISPYLQKAVVLTEDSGFWTHQGFDWEAIEKNARVAWETKVFKKGGSTITQQLAKNMFLSKDKNLLRKGVEAIITYRIEKTLTKKEILERYLNVIEFGKDIYGIKAASQYYFKKQPGDLNVVESAFLVMLLPNPVKYSRSYYKKELTSFARKRLEQIIGNMYKYNRINQTEYDVAVAQIDNFLTGGITIHAVSESNTDSDSTSNDNIENFDNTNAPMDPPSEQLDSETTN